MIFQDWMSYRGLSKSSVDKYLGSINGALSEWAMDAGLLAGPLTSLTSKAMFDAISPKLSALPIFIERNARGHHMYSSALLKFGEYLADNPQDDVEADIEAIVLDDTLTKTEKTALVKSRIGQGTFRQKLLLHWMACAVTGFKDTNLLVASHIRPWSKSSNAQRLDAFNGLLLSPNLDKAFDKGLITFDTDGKIKLSPLLTDPEKLGITADMRVVLEPGHEPYMAFHRSEWFKAK
jgi:putative restriction endonuclease